MRARFLSVMLLAAAMLNIAIADDLPQLTLLKGDPTEKYADSSSIVIAGHVEPPIDISLKVRLYHVIDEESVLLEGGTEARVQPDGNFSVTLSPRAGGWSVGTLRCMVHGEMRSLRDSVDFEIVEYSKPAPIDLPKDSEITIDLGTFLPRDAPYEVVAGQTFYVKGAFDWESDDIHVLGPRCRVRIIRYDPLRNRDVTVRSTLALTVIDETGAAQFDAPIVAPSPGTYIFQVSRPIRSEQRLEYATVNHALSVVPPRE